jgi:hypothetical protein
VQNIPACFFSLLGKSIINNLVRYILCFSWPSRYLHIKNLSKQERNYFSKQVQKVEQFYDKKYPLTVYIIAKQRLVNVKPSNNKIIRTNKKCKNMPLRLPGPSWEDMFVVRFCHKNVIDILFGTFDALQHRSVMPKSSTPMKFASIKIYDFNICQYKNWVAKNSKQISQVYSWPAYIWKCQSFTGLWVPAISILLNIFQGIHIQAW